MKQKNFQITPEDQAILDALKRYYNLDSEASVIRKVLRDTNDVLKKEGLK